MSIKNKIDTAKLSKVRVVEKKLSVLDSIFELKLLQSLTLSVVYNKLKYDKKRAKMHQSFKLFAVLTLVIILVGFSWYFIAKAGYNSFTNKYKYSIQGHVENEVIVYGIDNKKEIDPKEYNFPIKEVDKGSMVLIVRDKNKTIKSIELPDEVNEMKERKRKAIPKSVIFLVIGLLTNTGVFILTYGKEWCEYYKKIKVQREYEETSLEMKNFFTEKRKNNDYNNHKHF